MEFEVLVTDTMMPLTDKEIEKMAESGGLILCDLEGFAITEDGTLMLCDECGNYTYVAQGWLTIRFNFGGHTFEYDY